MTVRVHGIEAQDGARVVAKLAHCLRELSGVAASRGAVGLAVNGPIRASGLIPSSFGYGSAHCLVSRLPVRSRGDAGADLGASTRECQGTWLGATGS